MNPEVCAGFYILLSLILSLSLTNVSLLSYKQTASRPHLHKQAIMGLAFFFFFFKKISSHLEENT